MNAVLSCVTHAHDYGMLALAAAVCTFGSWAAVRTFIKARTSTSETSAWIGLATVATATTAWSTHFLGMMAYRPGMPAGFDMATSALSLAFAFVGCGLGLNLASKRRIALAPEMGGAILGASIAGMHFIGMAAYRVTGHIAWDRGAVGTAIALAVGFGALALSRASRPLTKYCRYGGMGGLMLAILSLHFTAMSAMTLTFDPRVDLGAATLAHSTFAYAIAAVAALLFATTAAAQVIDKRTGAAAALRMKRLTEVTTDGIVIVRDGRITDTNQQVLGMLKTTRDRVAGLEGRTLWDRRRAERRENASDTFESEMIDAEGDRIPVQVSATQISASERVYAFRDLRPEREVEARMLHLAHHDPLTDLANRAAFNKSLDAAIADGTPMALVYVDLDEFKEVNDQHGHATGDAVLIETAGRLKAAFPSGTVARLGGDEFAAMVDLAALAHGEAGALEAAAALAEAMTQPFRWGGRTLGTAASVGVALHPRHGSDREALMAAADMAMYQAKSERRHGARLFDAVMAAAASRRRRLGHDLTAMTATATMDGLAVHYQVQTDVGTGAVVGFEALARWTHPELGQISPAEFIPIAEENGTIGAIGAWVMGRACRDARRWDEGVKIAVNVSPAQLGDDLVGRVAAVLAETGLTPSRLEIEITESMLIADKDKVLVQLKGLQALGVSVALDDFGTGWSSLSTLQAFPFDKIKIDRSFVELVDTCDQAKAIVRAVVTLGRSLEIPVLAEGVQRDEHMAFLLQHGCASAQGYLMGRPETIDSTMRHGGRRLAAIAAA